MNRTNFEYNQKQITMSLLTILLNIFLPPVAVVLQHGVGGKFLVSIILTLIGWIPGVIHAFYINS